MNTTVGSKKRCKKRTKVVFPICPLPSTIIFIAFHSALSSSKSLATCLLCWLISFDEKKVASSDKPCLVAITSNIPNVCWTRGWVFRPNRVICIDRISSKHFRAILKCPREAHDAKVVEWWLNERMMFAQNYFSDAQCLLMVLLRFVKVALPLFNHSQSGKSGCHFVMLFTKNLFLNGQCPLQELFSTVQLIQMKQDDSKQGHWFGNKPLP